MQDLPGILEEVNPLWETQRQHKQQRGADHRELAVHVPVVAVVSSVGKPQN